MVVSDVGNNQNQLMISKWKNGNALDAIDKANKIASNMANYGLHIERIKVESMMHNKGVPTEQNNDNDTSHYFEFHIKYMCSDVHTLDKIKK